MKKSLVILLIFSLTLSFCVIGMPPSSIARDRPLKSVFIDTMFGLATGTVIATAVTVADGNAHGDDWGRNLGIGATIGAFVGLAFGIASESQSLTYFDGKQLNFRFPMPRPYTSSDSESPSALCFELIDWRF